MKQELRCGHCRRKLGEGNVISLTVKCPRCKTLNTFQTAGPSEPPDQNAAERVGTGAPAHAEVQIRNKPGG